MGSAAWEAMTAHGSRAADTWMGAAAQTLLLLLPLLSEASEAAGTANLAVAARSWTLLCVSKVPSGLGGGVGRTYSTLRYLILNLHHIPRPRAYSTLIHLSLHFSN